MKVTFEFGAARIEVAALNARSAFVLTTGGGGEATRWDLYCLESFLVSLRNKMERESADGLFGPGLGHIMGGSSAGTTKPTNG